MSRDLRREVEREDARSLAFRDWLNARRQNIHANVSAANVLSLNGVVLRRSGDQEEQISCPFHGADNKPSARYHLDSPRSPSGVWCFVCHERWDCIKLWMKFAGGTIKYTEALFQIEKAFNLTVPQPEDAINFEDTYDPLQDEVDKLFEVCDSRLRENRDKFDLTSHLRLGSILDRTRYYLSQGALTLPQTKERLTKVLDKIGEKIRAKAPTTP